MDQAMYLGRDRVVAPANHPKAQLGLGIVLLLLAGREVVKGGFQPSLWLHGLLAFNRPLGVGLRPCLRLSVRSSLSLGLRPSHAPAPGAQNANRKTDGTPF